MNFFAFHGRVGKYFIFPLFLFCAWFFSFPQSFSAESVRVSGASHSNEYLVKLKDTWRTLDHITEFQDLLDAVGGAKLDALNIKGTTSLRNTLRVKLRSTNQSQTFFALASSFSFVESVTPNLAYRPLFVPNDPLFSQQWNLEAIHAREAWDTDATTPTHGGDPGVIVAVIDSGVAYETYNSFVQAPDLAGTSFVAGYDFADNDSHPNDDNGHGTHVTGTIAQATNNALGSAGIAFHTSIMPIRVCNPLCFTSTIAQGILYAKNNGAKVINISLGGETVDNTLLAAIQEAVAAGVVIVSGAGNGGIDNVGDPALYYPAAYSEVIAVGATRFDNTRASYSNYGNGLDVVAPGGDGNVDQNNDSYPDGILQQTFPGMCETGAPTSTVTFEYAYCQGTSMAAPHVSAVAALLFSAGYSAADIPAIIRNTAVDLGSAGYDVTFGNGLINAQTALATPLSGTLTVANATTVTQQISRLSLTKFGAKGAVEMSFSNDSVSWSAWETFVAEKTWDVFDSVYGGSAEEGPKTIYARLRDASGRQSAVMTTSSIIDPSAPVVTILGSNPLRAVKGSTYVDPGATASDSIDGDLTSRVQIVNTVNTALHGSYDVTYMVADSSGNVTRAVRTVFVEEPFIVTGPKRGGGPQIRVFSSLTGDVISQFTAYEKTMKAGINVAVGDINGDGTKEIIVSSRESGKPTVRVFDLFGKTKNWDFVPYGSNFRGGISVSVGDLEGDGIDEIITAPMESMAPLVQIFGLRGNAIRPVTKGFFAFEKNMKTGVSISVGDLDGNGKAEIITSPLSQKNPRLRVFGLKNKAYAPLMPDISVFGVNFTGGVISGVGDFNKNGNNEIVAGASSSAGSHIRFFGKKASKLSLVSPGFFAYAPTKKIGLSLAVIDVDGDGTDDMISGEGTGGSEVRIFNGAGKRIKKPFSAYVSGFKGGITVAAGYRH